MNKSPYRENNLSSAIPATTDTPFHRVLWLIFYLIGLSCTFLPLFYLFKIGARVEFATLITITIIAYIILILIGITDDDIEINSNNFFMSKRKCVAAFSWAPYFVIFFLFKLLIEWILTGKVKFYW